MDKAEQPTVTQALKPCPEVEAIAQEIADRSAWKKTTDNYARIYQAAYAGAIAAMNTRTTSLAAQDGLVEALRLFVGCAYPVAEEINQRGHNWCEAYLDDALPIARAALASLGEQHD